MTTVELSRATKRFSEATIDVSLRVESGRQLVLLGPSGGGKTTVLRMIAGLTELDAGEVAFDGQSVVNLPPERRGVAMVFQEPTLFPFRTVAENVEYGLKVARVSADERMQRVAASLEDVQLPGFAERWPHELSGGQRQRVAIARAIIVEPRVLLLDEPLASLDPALRDQLQLLICSVQRRHRVTSIFVTHDQSVARAVADEVAVMVDGTIAETGPFADLLAEPIDERVACFLEARPRSMIAAMVRRVNAAFGPSSSPTWPLALARIALGVMWLTSLRWKLPPDFESDDTSLREWLELEVEHALVGFYGSLIDNVVLANFTFFAWVLFATELLVGLALVLGLRTRVAAFVGLAMSVNLFIGLADVPGEWPWSYAMMIMWHGTILVSNAGDMWSVERRSKR